MPVKRENIRISVTVSRKIHDRLIEEADYQGRSVSNFVASLIKFYFKNKDKISLDE